MGHFDDAMRAIKSEEPFRLARRIDVAQPDRCDSPGGLTLAWIRDTLVDEIERKNIDASDRGNRDRLHELLQPLSGASTHELWETFTDLCLYQEDADGIDGSDIPNLALAMIEHKGEELLQSLFDEIHNAIDDDEMEAVDDDDDDDDE